MRTLTGPERTRLAASRLNIYTKVEVQDADLAWKDVSTLAGIDFFDGARWSDDLDAPVMSGTVSLRREAKVGGTTYSLAPLLQASTLNRNAAAAYAPLLDVARGIRITTAVTDPAVAPVAGDQKEVFLGIIDEVDWKGSESVVTVPMRDQGARLLDTFIEVKRTYSNSGGNPVQTVMQAILDDNLGVGVVTLYVPASPGWNITTYEQEQTNVMEAIRALALQIGWDVRYRYDAANVFRLTLYGPDRAKTVADATFAPTEYTEVPAAKVSSADVRNAGKLWYTDIVTHARLSVSATDTTSITRFGRRFLEFEEAAGGNIDTAGEANAMLSAAISDLSTPVFEHEIETFYWWPAQIGDLYEFTTNAVHYDTSYKLALASLTHELAQGHGRTTLRCRGQPAGAYRDWLRRGKVNGGPSDVTLGQPVILSLTVTMRDDGTLLVNGLGNDETASWRMNIRTDRPPTDTEVRAGTIISGRDLVFDSTGVTTYSEGQTAYVGAFAYQGDTATGLESVAPSAQGQAMRFVSDYPTASITVLTSTAAQESLRLSGTLGLHGGGPIQYRYAIDTSFGPGSFSGWAGFPDGGGLYDDITINRQKTLSSRIILEVRDVLLHVGTTEKTISSQLEAIDSATGLSLTPGVRQSDGVTLHASVKGFLEYSARHGDPITFPFTYQHIPAVEITGGLLSEPRAKWGATGDGTESGAVDTAKPQYPDCVALNLTASGLTVRARLRQKAATTARTANFSASNVLDAVGETTEATLANAPSDTDQYMVHFAVTLSADYSSGLPEPWCELTVVVAIDTYDGTSWTERASRTYYVIDEVGTGVTQTWTHEEVLTPPVSGLDSTDKVRLRAKTVTPLGAGVTSFSVHGFDGSGDPAPNVGVTYNTASDVYASKTPDTADRVTVRVMEVS